MADEIFILGYGSLIWDLDDLAPSVVGPWQMSEGPTIPLEFSRVSPKRKGALAVVIDDRGDLCPTHAIASTRDSIEDAVNDLARRERTQSEYIGFVDVSGGVHRTRSVAIADRVATWCAKRNAAGAVWTELQPNFEPFTIDRAMLYLSGLEGESLAAALEYISRAPASTDTPLRRALAVDPWWQNVSAKARR